MLSTTALTPQLIELAEQLGAHLQRQNQTVSTAESCTGGGIGYAITEVAGSSAWFNGGLITYTNTLKHALLSVDEAVLENHGAVSKACIEQMAIGARQSCCSDWSVAVSGVAGPGGGSDDKPVGLVWMAIANHDTVWAWSERFPGNRTQIRLKTIEAVFRKLINRIEIQYVI